MKKAKQPDFTQRIAALRRDATIAAVRAALQDPIGLVVEAASELCVELNYAELAPTLVEAFARLRDTKFDVGCKGKCAIARALDALDCWEPSVFEAGLLITQFEGPEIDDDSAAALRGLCAIAHARFLRDDALDVAAMLLLDPCWHARLGAAKALGTSARRDATALLRYHLRRGEPDDEVRAACFEALLDLGRTDGRTISWIASQLGIGGKLAESAALALGVARCTAQFVALRAWCSALDKADRQRVGYLPLALLRDDEATAYLVEVVATMWAPDAIGAATALATFKDDPIVADAIRTAAEKRDPSLRRSLLALLQ